MTRSTFLAATALAVACGSVKDRGDCRSSADCIPGEYCAHTSEGSVCWPDAVPPGVTSVTVALCEGGCLRDGQLVVTAEVTDDKEVFAVQATADVDPDHAFTLTHEAGNRWSGTIAMGQLDFPALKRDVTVTVRAFDGGRNEAKMDAEPAQVTRVRWVAQLDSIMVTPTPPTVAADGTVIVGGSDGKLHFFTPSGGDARAAVQVAGGAIAQAPSIGAQGIWVAANDGKLYGVKHDGSGELEKRTCTASGLAVGPPAVLTTSGVDVAFGAFANGRIYASGPTCVPTVALVPAEPFSGGVAVGDGGMLFAASSTAPTKALRQYAWDGEALATGWAATIGDTSVAPLAIDPQGNVVSGSEGGHLERTSGGSAASVCTLGSSIDSSPIILSDGNIVVGDAAGKLHRLAADGTPVWTTPVELGDAVYAPMALTGGRFLVATADGKLHALAGDGTPLWSGALTAGSGLGAGNISLPDADGRSTAFFAGGDGKLYAVIVEGTLDTSAPWPKAWHDRRNTSRAGQAF